MPRQSSPTPRPAGHTTCTPSASLAPGVRRNARLPQSRGKPVPRPESPRTARLPASAGSIASAPGTLKDALFPVPISRSILVAEDHPDSRDALRTLLEAYGYEVFVAGDGAEAVQRAVEIHPDLILMDLMMPGVDGMEATRRLRSESDFRDVPIVALTAMEGGKDRALAAGFNDFVSKPINLPTFLRKLESWLSPPDAVAE